MKKLIPILMLILTTNILSAQDVTFTFSNAQNTNDGTDDFYEVDVMISTTSDFMLGSGQLYINYNTAAFGTNVSMNSNIELTYPNGTYILGQHEKDFNFGDLYKDYVTNDNTTSRVSFSWQQNYAAGVFAGNNVTGTAAALFHMKIKYADVAQSPNVCFESVNPFDDQTYTACGPFGSVAPLTVADCGSFAPTQITNDTYDCAGANLPPLPVELISFTARPENTFARLDWSTANELNNEGFEVQRLGENDEWEMIGFERGVGTSNQTNSYLFYDKSPRSGVNYYRLKQVDFDGKFEYSAIESVTFEDRKKQYAIFPNPTTSDFVNLEVPIEDTEVIIFDSQGKLIFEKRVNSGLHQISLDGFPGGMYFVKFQNGKDTQIERLIIQE